MKRGLEFIANRQNRITEENLHYLYQISTGDYLPDEDRLLPNHFYRHGEVLLWAVKNPDRDFRQSGFPCYEMSCRFCECQ